MKKCSLTPLQLAEAQSVLRVNPLRLPSPRSVYYKANYMTYSEFCNWYNKKIENV